MLKPPDILSYMFVGFVMKAKYLLPAVFASLLVGCGTVSQVNKEGNTADPVFPS